MNFKQKLEAAIKKNNSLLCIGLDPDSAKTSKPFFEFNKEIIDSTADLVCSYKPNIAFYEAAGIEGLTQLKKTIEYIHSKYPEIPVILDAKRVDVPNTAAMYAKAIFEYWDADAATIFPFLGYDSVEPFFKYQDKSPIIIIKTSNKDASTFEHADVAEKVKEWGFSNISLFVGATNPESLRHVRELFPQSPILTAGIGAQGASIEKTVKAGVDKNGSNLICNNSREIIYAENPREKAIEIKDTINSYR